MPTLKRYEAGEKTSIIEQGTINNGWLCLQKEPLQETLENLMSTTNLTDIILKDKSIELLLLKREIENKLQVGSFGNVMYDV